MLRKIHGTNFFHIKFLGRTIELAFLLTLQNNNEDSQAFQKMKCH
jgi:hypothetical protein